MSEHPSEEDLRWLREGVILPAGYWERKEQMSKATTVINQGVDLVGAVDVEDYQLYFLINVRAPISKENRAKLKYLGWKQKRHTRTNQEIWVVDK